MFEEAYEWHANGDELNKSHCVFMLSAKVCPEVQGQIPLADYYLLGSGTPHSPSFLHVFLTTPSQSFCWSFFSVSKS